MKKSGRLYFILFLVLTGSILFTCVKDPYKDQLSQEKTQIEDYIHKNNIKAIQTPSGLYYLQQDTGIGDRPDVGDYVLIKYWGKFLDGTLFDTTDSTDAQNMNGYSPWFKPGGPLIFSMNSTIFPGLVEGLSLLREGGKDTLIMPSSLAANTYTFAPRIYYVELLKVYHNIALTQQQFFDTTMVRIGFALNDSARGGIWIDTTNVLGDKSGVHFPSDTDRLAADYVNKVAIRYELRFIDGNVESKTFGRQIIVVDSFKYSMDTIPKPIFNDAVLKMKRSGTAKVYVPFYNAYNAGTYYDPNTAQILIPPYTNLQYTITFLGFVNDKWMIDKSKY